MTLRALLPIALVACTCPRAPCEAWLVLSLRAESWSQGRYTVHAVVGERVVRCGIEVPLGGAPALDDLSCSGLVEREQFVVDTFGPLDPSRLDLFGPVGPSDAVPARATVRLELDPADGPSVVLSETTVDLAWRARRSPANACGVTCLNAEVVVPVPPP